MSAFHPPRTIDRYLIQQAVGPDADGDLLALGALIGDGFGDLDVVEWLVPGDRDHRVRVFTRWVEMYAARAFDHGHVDVVREDDVPTAVAVWFTDPHAAGPPDADRQLARAVSYAHLHRFDTLDAVMASAHPHRPHHHHLLLLAVRPDLQGQGLGSALLAHHHQVLDQAGIGGYLEATNPENARLYERHGYRHHGEPLTLPGMTEPALFPMWREPQAVPVPA